MWCAAILLRASHTAHIGFIFRNLLLTLFQSSLRFIVERRRLSLFDCFIYYSFFDYLFHLRFIPIMASPSVHRVFFKHPVCGGRFHFMFKPPVNPPTESPTFVLFIANSLLLTIGLHIGHVQCHPSFGSNHTSVSYTH